MVLDKNKPLNIGIVVGELSGDTLGEGLIKAIREKYSDARFVGIGGPKMKALGCESLFDMEELAVMGLAEVLGRLPRLIQVKSTLVRYFKENTPDVFIGIDAPDFNLRLERNLKDLGITTVHYVSPSVWAWRQKRIFKIARATNLVLAFLPFEKAFYDRFNVPCEFIGHTLADSIPLTSDKNEARTKLKLDTERRWLAVLPGSRGGELKMLCRPFIETCQKLQQKYPDLGFVVALVNEKRHAQFEAAWQEIAPELDFTLINGTAREVITASDAVMLASGTVALECMLVNRPMVVGYRFNAVTNFLAKRLVKTKYVSLPNILADDEIVKELLLDECTSENLYREVCTLLDGDNSQMQSKFTEIHRLIRKDADKQAANAVLNLIEQ
ncbi:lipid-A-disaccharide synthase [Vibrio mangrovi]|uniref:Lipid-A-disaccharide synthase n=1 Tax=Vibrio mangrovi TaxID=474394 RepID=A0A1Y6IRV3_9VIBR|nr:lipid-A-disaccharide synthase [Vibrio mangrovi]MDW6001615.1 lipid-A-disaccharide synthase [Vibrio mangrovi]SMS00358.1 Lipid-A-disaccharide synthase [Vibrio mangrovi]